MHFREFPHGSNDYQSACELRDDVLRKPLGLALKPEDIAAEKNDLHFGLFDEGNQIMGCIVGTPLSTEKIHLRQMCIAQDYQAKGNGRRLIADTEERLKTKGFNQLVIHAKKDVAGFYERLGYSIEGDEFIEVGIVHLTMLKTF